jgi:hypothetical protein
LALLVSSTIMTTRWSAEAFEGTLSLMMGFTISEEAFVVHPDHMLKP